MVDVDDERGAQLRLAGLLYFGARQIGDGLAVVKSDGGQVMQLAEVGDRTVVVRVGQEIRSLSSVELAHGRAGQMSVLQRPCMRLHLPEAIEPGRP